MVYINRQKLMRSISDESLEVYRSTGKLSSSMVLTLKFLREQLEIAEKALEPFAKEWAMWAEFSDDFYPRINDYDTSEPDFAEFNVGNLKQAAEILGRACVDEGCVYRGTPHSHVIKADESLSP